MWHKILCTTRTSAPTLVCNTFGNGFEALRNFTNIYINQRRMKPIPTDSIVSSRSFIFAGGGGGGGEVVLVPVNNHRKSILVVLSVWIKRSRRPLEQIWASTTHTQNLVRRGTLPHCGSYQEIASSENRCAIRWWVSFSFNISCCAFAAISAGKIIINWRYISRWKTHREKCKYIFVVGRSNILSPLCFVRLFYNVYMARTGCASTSVQDSRGKRENPTNNENKYGSMGHG